jgi:Cu/Ag efflux protein CusF
VVASPHADKISIQKRRPKVKKITTLFTALIVASSMTAFAADKATEVTPADAKSAQETTTDAKKSDGIKKAHHRHHPGNYYQGEVTAVDAKAGTVTVSRGQKTFTADEKLLSEVKVGDKVSVKFTKKDGQLTANDIKPAKAHHKKKEVKEPEEKKTEEKK